MVTEFVTELLRAANEVGKLHSTEVARLLIRSIVTICDLRERLEYPEAVRQPTK